MPDLLEKAKKLSCLQNRWLKILEVTDMVPTNESMYFSLRTCAKVTMNDQRVAIKKLNNKNKNNDTNSSSSKTYKKGAF